ncbi:MAG: PaaI family thioesterase [Alicyclobacillaceae bacterium]|uniref:PaaI family thioesterase n=1 Tax=Alicyclobacillus sp. SP_1 TaxID=2942475 RepID=UPI002156F7E5|nr:PaaI family thioesterase [Alicyclobacillus sp. SP_1]MCY0887805.1 PaaI family thioesterase [Alicyclobacillaceae bacterium]MCY0896084.1 PaaI family thioesterase [Alicyclobacillaceae bacterium]
MNSNIMSQLLSELEHLPEDELHHVLGLVRAKKATYHKPLAFIQAIMKFRSLGKLEDGQYEFEMTVADELLNRYGILHGGLMTAFLDTAMAETAFLIDTTVERAFTLNIHVDFIKPGLPGQIRAAVEVVQNSKTIIVFHTTAYNEDGEVVAMAMAHFYKQRHKSPKEDASEVLSASAE